VRRRRHGPVPDEVRAAREADLVRRRDERAARRQLQIAAAAADLAAEGRLSHEAVAARAEVPVGFVRWAYPDLEVLAGTTRASLAS
jgi:DNA-binding transcriptional regulator YbjK